MSLDRTEARDLESVEAKDNIVRFITNLSPLLLYELNMLRVSSPSSEVQQRIITKKISIFGCGRHYNFKRYQ